MAAPDQLRGNKDSGKNPEGCFRAFWKKARDCSLAATMLFGWYLKGGATPVLHYITRPLRDRDPILQTELRSRRLCSTACVDLTALSTQRAADVGSPAAVTRGDNVPIKAQQARFTVNRSFRAHEKALVSFKVRKQKFKDDVNIFVFPPAQL